MESRYLFHFLGSPAMVMGRIEKTNLYIYRVFHGERSDGQGYVVLDEINFRDMAINMYKRFVCTNHGVRKAK